MERAQFLSSEMEKIKEKAETTKALVLAQRQGLDEQQKHTDEIKNSIEAAAKQVSEAKSKLWQFQTSRLSLTKQNKEVRETCYERGQDVDTLNTTLKDCQTIYQNIVNILASTCIEELETRLDEFEKLLNEQREKEERKILELENFYKPKIEAKGLELHAMEEDVKKLDKEAEDLKQKMFILKKTSEENQIKLEEMRNEDEKLKLELEEKRAMLNEEKLNVALREEKVKEKLEEMNKENFELLQEINLKEEELRALQEKENTITNEMQTQKVEKEKLKTKIKQLKNEVNTLQLEEKFINTCNEHIFHTSLFYGFKFDDSLTTQENLKNCNTFLASEIEFLNEQEQEFQESTKNYQEKMRDSQQKRTDLKNQTDKVESRIAKLKSDRLVAEHQYTEIQLELKQETEKQNKELEIVKQQVTDKAEHLHYLNEEIKQAETERNKERNKFCEKEKELDVTLERLADEKKHLIQKLAESTEQLKLLEKDVNDLYYDMVKLSNKSAQLVRAEREKPIAQLPFKKPSNFEDMSDSSAETLSISALKRRKSTKKH